MYTAELQPIFPTPVLLSNIGREYTQKELDFIFSLDLRENSYNKASVDSHVLENPKLKKLKKELLIHVENFLKHTTNPKEKINTYITQSWVNFTRKGECHHLHSHPNSFISGVLYVQASEDEDKIYFAKDKKEMFDIEPEEYNLFNSSSWFFPVKTGMLVLFPSSLHHRVQVKESDQLRVSLSFNTFLSGTIGKDRELTLLTLP